MNLEISNCWIDCDPGNDDCLAILLAANSKNINIIGISTVVGNQSIENTTNVALISMYLHGLIKPVLGKLEEKPSLKNHETYGMKCPLVIGASRPLLRHEIKIDDYNYYGLKDPKFKLPEVPENALKYIQNLNSSNHFTQLMYESIRNSLSKITLLALGPLTNLALLIINYPDIINYIDRIVIMGGSMALANAGPVAEFNIKIDPEAALYVLESGLPIYIIPLDVTHTALITPNIIEKINSLSSNFSNILVHLLQYFAQYYKDVFSIEHPPLHDPCAVAFIIDPSLFDYKHVRVDIETKSELTYGQTVCHLFDSDNLKKNAFVCLKMNVNKFWDLFIDAVKTTNQITPANKLN